MSPGPTQLYLMSRAVKTGWQRTLPGALAPLITDAPIIALTILILTRLPETFLFGLQIVGNLFILYLAFNAFQAFRTFEVYQPGPDQADAKKTLAEAALTNLLNPRSIHILGNSRQPDSAPGMAGDTGSGDRISGGILLAPDWKHGFYCPAVWPDARFQSGDLTRPDRSLRTGAACSRHGSARGGTRAVSHIGNTAASALLKNEYSSS